MTPVTSSTTISYISSSQEAQDNPKCQKLKEHFDFFCDMLGGEGLIPDACCKKIDGMTRCLSGINTAFFNAMVGVPKYGNWDKCIDEQIDYFGREGMPFIWQVDETMSPEFQQKLEERGFFGIGTLLGMIGELQAQSTPVKIPEGYEIKRVTSKDVAELDTFTEILCKIFQIPEEGGEAYKQFLSSTSDAGTMVHWVAMKDNEVVSTASIVVEGDAISYWNIATVEAERGQHVSTALCETAREYAIQQGCRTVMAYLTPEEMAGPIFENFGCTTEWKFNGFISPGVMG